MKKYLGLFLVAVISSIILVGCSNTTIVNEGSAQHSVVEDNKERIRLTGSNICDYLHIETTSKNTQETIYVAGIGIATYEKTVNIKIYPKRDGRFDNTILYLSVGGNKEYWGICDKDSSIIECTDDSSDYYRICFLKVELPASGEYEKTIRFSGKPAALETMDSITEVVKKLDNEFYRAIPENFPALVGEKPVKGTYISN